MRRRATARALAATGPVAAASLLASALLALPAATPLAAQWRAAPVMVVAEAGPRLASRSPPPALRVDPALGVDRALRVDRELRGGRADPASPAEDYNLIGAGVLAAAAGTLGGALVGYHLDYQGFRCGRGCDDEGVGGLAAGWFFGGALTTPLAVHLVNGRGGLLSPAYLSSGLIAGVGLASMLAIGSPEGAYVALAAPVAQVISAVLIERRTTQ